MPPDLFVSAYETPAQSPGFLLWQVTNLWQRRQRAALKALDLTHVQFVLLAALSWLTREDEQVTQVQLAQFAQVDVMMASQVVRTLTEKGMIERGPHPRDTRANLLRVTPHGQAAAVRAIRLVEQVDREFFSILDSGVDQLTRFLQQLLGGAS